MTRKRKYKRLIYTLLIFVMLVISVISGRVYLSAYADAANYSNVLDDLQKDESFNLRDYPDNKRDYSIKVIQVAESNRGELFVYTYQPCQKTTFIIATEINMSLSESTDGTKLYKLGYLNSSGNFAKYRVEGVSVSTDVKRYYNITSIYRTWDKSLDGFASNGNSKNAVAYGVGKLFTVETVSGVLKYTCKNVDVVEIKAPFVDFLSYGESSGWDLIFDVVNWTDIHYIAFSTDKKIDTLKEADVTYTTQPYHYTGKDNQGYTYGEESEAQYITLTGKEEFSVDGKKYTWNSIYRTDDFIKTTELTGEAKEEVEKSEFVLVFLKTPFKEQEKWSFMQGHYKESDGVKVSNVAILRLKFETDGKTYNLGTVMDKQEGDTTSGNKPESNSDDNFFMRLIKRIADFFKNIWKTVSEFAWWQWLLIGLSVILAIGLIIALIKFGIKSIFKGIWWLIKTLLLSIWELICLPFRFIAGLFRRGEK